MASSTASSQAHGTESDDIQAAIAKTAELRSLHAKLLQRRNLGGGPFVLGPPVGAASFLRHSNPHSTAEDYPVFTPSYEEESLPGFHYIRPETRSLSETWSAIQVEGKNDATINIDAQKNKQNICSRNEHLSKRSSCINHISFLQASLVTDTHISSSGRSSPGEHETIKKCNACKPVTISREPEREHRNLKTVSSTTSLHDTGTSKHVHTKHRGPVLSWLFPKSKRKPKPEMLPHPIESEEMSQFLNDWGLLSFESLKKELLEANKNKDAALAEVTKMRSLFGELQQKLVNLETYCEELKKALKQAAHVKSCQVTDRPNLPKRTKTSGCVKDELMPVSHEVMMEGFLQIVSEARLSIKQFSKMLIHHIEETECDMMEKLNLLLQHQQMSSSKKHSKVMLYHVEALINQCLYQDFENCIFQKNGSPKFLDPQQERRENYLAFLALRNLSWNEVLHKGTKYYSKNFSMFCDQKMSCIALLLNWSRLWPEQLLQCFFIAAKFIWLLHLLAFSFSPPLMILRVDENRIFDPLYMEDILLDKKRAHIAAQVKIMVMPGFYIQDKVLKCRVLCESLSLAK
ncbi:unnamed protein product [Musa acuminata subsp. malaccensis]|uniref:(wild Malaysian banana) hypothetical protein n=1 Tax=Musa acuminata subsp. malaccensis TaxID=214687 RepID=A0A804JR66_MUSAM|nr:PREDICTED: IRK-interacting protein-like [Musa acuminata subsp. malaccensis]CAG1855361.1 unnamed protein product [Musa acuminata subsp. malaccensis]